MRPGTLPTHFGLGLLKRYPISIDRKTDLMMSSTIDAR
jgi:hypothetical protein